MLQRKEYVKYAKVFPLTEAFNIKVPAKWYRRIIGSLEIICGLAMAFVPVSKYLLAFNIFENYLLVISVDTYLYTDCVQICL